MSELPNNLAETVRMQAKNRGDAVVFEPSDGNAPGFFECDFAEFYLRACVDGIGT